MKEANSYTIEDTALTTKKVLVLGLSCIGQKITESLWEKYPDYADYVVIGADFNIFRSKIENKIFLNELTACGTTINYDTHTMGLD